VWSHLYAKSKPSKSSDPTFEGSLCRFGYCDRKQVFDGIRVGIMYTRLANESRASRGYKTLEALGPEHEFSIVDEKLKPLPIADVIIKQLCGRVRNTVSFPDFVLGKELQKHVMELKAAMPFRSPQNFEETMYGAAVKVLDILEKFGAHFLGLGMHPTLSLDETRVWDHWDRQIYEAFDRIFDLKQHGWLNIQSFQLNISYRNESEAVKLYNALAGILPYISAISAASPICESRLGDFANNRLHYYWINQAKIPSITGEIIPEPIDSFETYRNLTIRRYSEDLVKAKAPSYMMNQEWVNSRGAIIRFDRKAIEIRVMDEQECIKSDVALSCFIRALLRGMMQSNNTGSDVTDLSHCVLVRNLNVIIRDGLDAKINHGKYPTARDLCRKLYEIAYDSASEEEKRYLWVIKKRIEDGSLSDTILKHVQTRSQKTDLNEAILVVYSELAEKLGKNEIYV